MVKSLYYYVSIFLLWFRMGVRVRVRVWVSVSVRELGKIISDEPQIITTSQQTKNKVNVIWK